jgi:hypothetical protein
LPAAQQLQLAVGQVRRVDIANFGRKSVKSGCAINASPIQFGAITSARRICRYPISK